MVTMGIVAMIILLLPHATLLLLSLVPDGAWTWQTYPTALSLENFRLLFDDPNVWEPVRNSLITTEIVCVGVFIFGMITSYTLVKLTFVGKTLLNILVLIPCTLPATVISMHVIC